MMSITFDADAAFAPLTVRVSQPIAAPADIAWSVLTDEPATWGDWCPGFDHTGCWTRRDPDGTGRARAVRVFGVRFTTEIHVADPGRRWSFRIAESSLPYARGMVEDWSFEPLEQGCVLHWTGGVWPLRPLRIWGPFAAGPIRFLARRFGKALAREAEPRYRDPRPSANGQSRNAVNNFSKAFRPSSGGRAFRRRPGDACRSCRR